MRRILEGKVISNKMDKTVVVQVQRQMRHPKYEKLIKKFKKYYAHDAENKAQIGQKVRIEETRPLSRLKRFRVIEIM